MKGSYVWVDPRVLMAKAEAVTARLKEFQDFWPPALVVAPTENDVALAVAVSAYVMLKTDARCTLMLPRTEWGSVMHEALTENQNGLAVIIQVRPSYAEVRLVIDELKQVGWRFFLIVAAERHPMGYTSYDVDGTQVGIICLT